MKKRVLILGAALVGFLITSPNLNAQVSDDFSDLNDTANPTWDHDWKLANSTGQSWDASTGVYRLQAPNNGYSGYGYVGSIVGPAYTDTTVSADFVSFINNGGLGGVFGVMARVTSPAGGGGFNNMKAYGYAYEPFAASGAGEMVLYKINGLSIGDVGSQQVTLDPNKDYRFTLQVSGDTLYGQVYDIAAGVVVAQKSYTDATPYLNGRSGVFGYSGGAYPATDFSVDNFLAVPEPAAGLLLGLGLLGLAGRGMLRQQF